MKNKNKIKKKKKRKKKKGKKKKHLQLQEFTIGPDHHGCKFVTVNKRKTRRKDTLEASALIGGSRYRRSREEIGQSAHSLYLHLKRGDVVGGFL